MDPWTPATRDEFIKRALTTDESRGQQGPYHFRCYPKQQGNEPIDEDKRSVMSEALAKVIYENPQYRIIALQFYKMLVEKIRTSTFVNVHFGQNFFILLKGSTAYRMLLGMIPGAEQYAESFPYSDLDLVIYINPYLDEALFNNLRAALNSILLQVVSQYKRALDHMLFLNKPAPDWFLDTETVAAFKADLQAYFDTIGVDGVEGKFLTPFENDEVRNTCSKNSFVLRNSETQEATVVRVEVPHFEKCERIPLRKTPLMASYNSTISFNRAGAGAPVALASGDVKGEFDLYRLKFMGMFVRYDQESNDFVNEKIQADFIDITIARRDDAELLDFWHYGFSTNVMEQATKLWMVVPDLSTCVRDLYKMLYVYEGPESKREKREHRYALLTKLMMEYGTQHQQHT